MAKGWREGTGLYKSVHTPQLSCIPRSKYSQTLQSLSAELFNRWQELSRFDDDFTRSSDFEVQCCCLDSDGDQSKS